MARLRGDVRGNTLAIMAASLIPLIGMIGGGLDASRLYLAKSRLQQACDAGALAGRKVMGGGTWDYHDHAARGVADKFFEANFVNGDFGTGVLTKNYTESAGTVQGTASVVVPMTLMRVLNFRQMTLSATCSAEMRLPNTDVMFVLDNTASMNETLTGDSRTKIVGLKEAVKCFYEIVARQDTDANCAGSAPSGGLSDQVQVRFGFVPYSVNVNVGGLLKHEWMADRWTYQSRQVVSEPQTFYDKYVNGTPTATSTSYGPETAGNWTGGSKTATSSSDCATKTTNTAWSYVSETKGSDSFVYSASEDVRTNNYQSVQKQSKTEYKSVSYASKLCSYQVRQITRDATISYSRVDNGVPVVKDVFVTWSYKPVEFDVSGLKNKTDPNKPYWNTRIALPKVDRVSRVTAGKRTYYIPFDKTIDWPGCIEERDTVPQADYDPIPERAYDLDIDRIPDSDTATRWRPLLPNIVFTRGSDDPNIASKFILKPFESTNDYKVTGTQCLKTQAKKLQTWDSTPYQNYVNSMTTGGNTYHDIGLLWGARLLSPTGLFASENRLTPRGGEIERHLIFMTDGDACTSPVNYTAYGHTWFDRRQTDPNITPPGFKCDRDSDPGILTKQVTARYSALCKAVRNKNITLWVIWFGENLPTIENNLSKCATPGRFFAARKSDELQDTFRSIANQISQLRLTQ